MIDLHGEFKGRGVNCVLPLNAYRIRQMLERDLRRYGARNLRTVISLDIEMRHYFRILIYPKQEQILTRVSDTNIVHRDCKR